MHSIIFILGLCLWITRVAGSPYGAPYQALLHWYAYRMDIDANGLGLGSIAPGCRTANGPCDFDDLTKYLQSPGGGRTLLTGATSVGTDLTPDIDNTVMELRNLGFNAYVDATKLLPSNFVSTTRPTFRLIYETLALKIEAITMAHPGAFSTGLSACKTAISAVHECRASDLAPYRVKDLNAFLAPKGLTVQTTTKTPKFALAMSGWADLDMDATLNKIPASNNALIGTIKSYVATYGSPQATGKQGNSAISHVDAMTTCQDIRTRLDACQ